MDKYAIRSEVMVSASQKEYLSGESTLIPPPPERPAPPSADLWIAAGLFMLALIIRILFGCSHEDLTFFRFSVSGVPFSDAVAWHNLAMDLAEGSGMMGDMGARRPLYSILLACVYTWFGPSFLLGKTINILAGALLVAFVYLIGKKIFNGLIGLFLAFMLALEEGQILFSLSLMSEPSGALLFAACIYSLLLGIEKHSKSAFFLSGVLLGLSNLARPLTLPSFVPFLFCIYFLLKKDALSRRAVFLPMIGFVLGIVLVLTPWIARQKATYGILSISSNTADSFYAATSPILGSWAANVDGELLQRGIFGVKERYDFLMKEGFANLRRYPLFFIKNFSMTFLAYLKDYYNTSRAFRLLVPSFLFFLFFIVPLKWPNRGRKTAMAALGICFIAFQHFAGSISHLIIVAGFALSMLYRRNGYPFLLASAFVFSGAVLVGADANLISRCRLLIVGWIFEAYHLFFYYCLFLLSSHRLFPGKTRSPIEAALPIISTLRLKAAATENMIRRLIQGFTLCLLLFFLVSAARLVYLNCLATPPPATPAPALSRSEKLLVLEKVRAWSPDLVAPSELGDPAALVEKNDTQLMDRGDHKKLIIAAGTVTPYVYPIPAHVDLTFMAPLFSGRPYDRTVVLVKNVGHCILSGSLPDAFRGRQVLVVGRLNVTANPAIFYEGRVIVEVITMIPWDHEKNRVEMESALSVSDEFHQAILRHFKPTA